MRYRGLMGERVGQVDDEIPIQANNVDEAMEKLLGYSVREWPKSDGEYDAVCWLEDDGGNVLATENVRIDACGNRVLLD